jgi:hypothetical protein
MNCSTEGNKVRHQNYILRSLLRSIVAIRYSFSKKITLWDFKTLVTLQNNKDFRPTLLPYKSVTTAVFQTTVQEIGG